MFNKKAQEGFSLTTLLAIIVGVVILIIVIVGFTGGYDKVFGFFEQAPGKSLQAAVSSCGIAGANGLKVDYCKEIRKVEISGVDNYVTCKWLGDNDYLESGDLLDCVGLELKETDVNNYCIANRLKIGDNVAGETCKKVATCKLAGGTVVAPTVNSQGNSLPAACASGASEVDKDDIVYVETLSGGSICCKA